MKKDKIVGFFNKPLIPYFTVAFLLYFTLEVLGRHSFFGAFLFLFTRPHIFLVNYCLVLFSFSIVHFVRRKIFCYSTIFCIWLTLGIINCVLIFMRNSPFNASDIITFKYGILITNKYMTPLGIIAAIVAILFGISFCVLMFLKMPKAEKQKKHRQSILITLLVMLLLIISLTLCLIFSQMSLNFDNLSEGFNNNGFPFSFIASALNHGVNAPEDYSPDSIQGIVHSLDKENKDVNDLPNVIVIQLESFFDPQNIIGVDFAKDPIPTFHKLSQEGVSGKLCVPVIGGGTSNTEFEVLTSMSLDFFGTVEYPYETFLKNKTCESVAYNFANLGYSTSAIHDFSAEFYSRNKVYSNLGFDRFTSLEYMSDVEYNEIGWPKDKILEKYIFECMSDSDSKDFIFSVSVQGHGSYPNEYEENDYDFIDGFDEDSQIIEFDKKIEYYTEQISQMDSFLDSLYLALKEYDERCILVVYGDHLPGINFTQDMLNCDMYQTDYLIWANYDINGENEDIETWQLMPKVQSIIGTNSGLLTRFHQKYKNTENYLPYLQTLEYDMVEGDNISLNNQPHTPSKITYGANDILIKSVQIADDGVYIMGNNFTPYSTIYVNDTRHNCEYIDSNTLFVKKLTLDNNDIIELGIFNYHNHFEVLSKVCSYQYKR